MKIQTPPSPEKKLLTGQNILFSSLPKHDAPYTSTPWQLAVQLASDNKVFFVDHPFTIIDLIKGFFRASIIRRIKAYFGSSSFTKSNVVVILTPFVFPVNFLPKGRLYDFFMRWNHRILSRRVNAVLRREKVQHIIYVNSFNFYFPQLHKFLQPIVTLNVYHCIDPMVKSFTLKHGSYLQQQAARESDMIITTAPSLQKQFHLPGYPATYLVPNAANFALFNRAVYEERVHPLVDKIQGKVFGYLGNIERRTDFNLLKIVLDILPDWHLVLAGPVEKQYVPPDIFSHPRIHLTGPVPHDQAPSMVRKFDVSIIPFKCDEVSSGIYPLKLFEYLAAGKPVVSTNFNPDVLTGLSDVVHVADTPTEMGDFILLSYATDSQEKRDKRIAVASQNTWENRAQLFSLYLTQELRIRNRQSYVA